MAEPLPSREILSWPEQKLRGRRLRLGQHGHRVHEPEVVSGPHLGLVEPLRPGILAAPRRPHRQLALQLEGGARQLQRVLPRADGFHFLRARPHATDPERCVFDNWWYASCPEGDLWPVPTGWGLVERDAEVRTEVFDYGEKWIGAAIDEDVEGFVRQQRGFRSRGVKGGCLSRQESRVRGCHELIDDHIEDRLPKRP